jgi:hypothetical protein
MADIGWEGLWKPMVVNTDTLMHLRDLAGEAQMKQNGEPFEWCLISLKDGSFRYPATRS